MKIKDVFKVFRKIAIAHPLINSFAVLDKKHQLNEDNLGKTAHQMRNDWGWYRKWEESGRDQSEIIVEYPLMFLEWKKGTSESLECADIQDIFITVATPENCEGCPDDASWEDVDVDNYEILKNVLRQMRNYTKYDITLTAGGTTTAWMTEEEKDARSSEIVSAKAVEYFDIENSEFQIVTSEFGIDELRSKTAEIQVQTVVDDQTMDYDYLKSIEQL